MASVFRTSYLGKRRLAGDGVGAAAVGVLVGRRRGGGPLVGVAQRCEVAAVLNTGAPLKLLTHTVAVKHITLTGFTLGDRRENE